MARQSKRFPSHCGSADVRLTCIDVVSIAICAAIVFILSGSTIKRYFRHNTIGISQLTTSRDASLTGDIRIMQKEETLRHSTTEHGDTTPAQRFSNTIIGNDVLRYNSEDKNLRRRHRHAYRKDGGSVVDSGRPDHITAARRNNFHSHISHGGPYIHHHQATAAAAAAALTTHYEGDALRATRRGKEQASSSYIADVGHNNLSALNTTNHLLPIHNYTSEEIHHGLSASATLWFNEILPKLACMTQGSSGSSSIFLYHVRKAAGTTVREVFQHYSRKHRIHFYETEGILLEHKFLDVPNSITCITFRNPVDRVVSLYWYEHVAWYYTITKQREKTRAIREWVDAWRDGAEWKTKFIAQNQFTNYVEIENYYIKSLLGYQLNRKVNENDLEIAKKVVVRFDVILISEWLSDEGQLKFLNDFFGGRMNIAVPHSLKGDSKLKQIASKHLTTGYEKVLEDIKEMNALDMQLYEYIKTIVAERILLNEKMAETVRDTKPDRSCVPRTINKDLSKLLGFHRPPGHKGPIDSFKF